jgi:hypothetical protein
MPPMPLPKSRNDSPREGHGFSHAVKLQTRLRPRRDQRSHLATPVQDRTMASSSRDWTAESDRPERSREGMSSAMPPSRNRATTARGEGMALACRQAPNSTQAPQGPTLLPGNSASASPFIPESGSGASTKPLSACPPLFIADNIDLYKLSIR